MSDDRRNKLVIVVLVFALLFNFPVLSVADRAASVFGLPALYLYLFAAWSLLIAITALIVRKKN